MGGYGSGSYYRWNKKETVEDYLSIDVRRWQRQGLLDERSSFTTLWSINGKKTSSISVKSRPNRVVLTYSSRTSGGEWEDISYAIRLVQTPCHFGGYRVWFTCPGKGCGRRVAKLFGGRYFLCRHCYGLTYRSQSEGALDRTMRRTDCYFDQIRSESSPHHSILTKPKNMHWKTYWRLFDAGMAECKKAKLHAANHWGRGGADVVEEGRPFSPHERHKTDPR